MRRWGVGVLTVATVAVLPGCGSADRRDPAAEARVVSETNAFCRYITGLPAGSQRSQDQIRAIQARLHVLLAALGTTAAYLPAGRDLNDAHAARRALFDEDRARSRAGRSRRRDFDARFERLQLRIYDDELALGVTCAGLAAEAHRVAGLLARPTS